MSTIERPARRPAWLPALILVAVLALLGPLGWRVGLALAGWAPLIGALLLGVLLLLLVAGLRLVNAYVRGIEARARQAELVTLQSGQPVHLVDAVTVGQRAAGRMLERHYDVELMRASGGQLAAQPAPMITVVDEAAQTAPAQLPAPERIDLARARERGLSGPEQWYIGQADDGGPRTITLSSLGMLAISGLTGGGKSNSAAVCAAQAAQHGALLLVCDPHYYKADSLSALLLPFAGAVGKFAVLPHEINALVRTVGATYERRIQNPARATFRIVMCIDEFLEQFINDRLSDESMRTLITVANGGRGVGMHILAISQQWGLGSKVYQLRDSISHGLLHRTPPSAARFLLRSAPDTQSYVRGEAILFGEGEPARVRVHHLQIADQQQTAQICGNTPRQPYVPSAPPTLAPARAATTPTIPVAPPPPPTNQDRILALLASTATPLTHSEMATALGADVKVISTEAKTLFDAGKVARRACTPRRQGEHYEYFQSTNQSTNRHTPHPSGISLDLTA